jgi:colanic acid/amylovoran biosynthesis glycosyltransferase
MAQDARAIVKDAQLRVVHYLAEYLSLTAQFVLPLLREAHHVSPEVWAIELSENPPLEGRWPVHAIGPGSSGWRQWLERLDAWRHRFELREEQRFASTLATARRPDIVHAHFGPQGYAAAEPCARAGIPLVTTFYGYDLGIAREPAWARRYSALWRKGALFLAEGPFMAQRLVELGAPRDRVRLQPLPVPVRSLPFRSREWRPGERLELLQVARLVEKKGVDLTIRLLPKLPQAVLTLVGDGPLRPPLLDLSRRLGVESRVTFLGSRRHAETVQLLLAAHLLVQPSRTASDGDTEGGAPYTLLEAQASGLPVVASRHADIPHTVAPDAFFGFAEDDLDGLVGAIEAALAAAPRWPALGRAARAYVEERHSADRLVHALESTYAALAGS